LRAVAIMLAFVPAAAANVLVNPPHTVDGLAVVEGARQLLAGAEADNVKATPDGKAIQIAGNDPKDGRDTASASITLRPIRTTFPFNEAVPFWNGWAPPGGSFRVMMRTIRGDKPGPWFLAGSWRTSETKPAKRKLTLPDGKYDIDTLLLEKPADAVQFRIEMSARRGVASPKIRLIGCSYTNSLGNKQLWKQFGRSSPAVSTALRSLTSTETLPIPFRSQVVSKEGWTNRVCSAAAVSMALEFFGVKYDTLRMARMVYDQPADLFGVWHRCVQAAAQEGLRGYITRFRTWDDVQAEIRRGSVICASIRFQPAELANPPRQYRTRGTKGHIIVIKGFAPGGKVIVNNSGSKAHGPDQVWTPGDLAKAWFDKGGVAFVFTGRVDKPTVKSAITSSPQAGRTR
jgi:hypothetical protein